ncbi:hypothetical protein AKJ64_00360 [candidate division MSBL1 archaeon SCGC-AAA259E17]|uniref:Nickel transporter n=1 Tax=candidate division MSBL1 archaeon SCGC-AAA259E17 TaxID=1698263 RepID=A0A133UH22_9EURY|nr:hypothetical protein AKJ64_00360 [candidate division MSBL1 archaeon SCGC-AAA259E17]
MEVAEHTHFTMVLPGGDMSVTPEDYIAKELGVTKEILIVWGHPYEHILFDYPEEQPPEVHVRKPDGTVKELTPTSTTVQGKKAYSVTYTVDQRGDHIIYVKLTAPEHGLIDYTKAVIHCGTEVWQGWNAKVGQDVEIIPYMRPYGMEEGFVFKGKALYNGEPLTRATVAVEKYHWKDTATDLVERAEEKFPYDPPIMYTRIAKTDGDGEFCYTLDEPGIWFVGAKKKIKDQLDKRGVFIVPVLEAFSPKGETSQTGALEISIENLQSAVDSLKSEVNSLKKTVESMESGGTSPALVYSGIGVAIAAILISIFAVSRK